MSEGWVVRITVEYYNGKWRLNSIRGRIIGAALRDVVGGFKYSFGATIESEPVENLKDLPYITEDTRNEIMLVLISKVVGRYIDVCAAPEDVEYYRNVCKEIEAERKTK